MKSTTNLARRRLGLALALGGLAFAASGMSLFGNGAARPAPEQFGLGPKPSAHQVYLVTLQPAEPLRTRKLQTVPVLITDPAGRPVEGVKLSIDGGMPEHSHGLPTQPRMGRSLGAGVYELEGVRFNMGGWWELKLAIESPAGADNITFNLQL
jgi:hypothetical protein